MTNEKAYKMLRHRADVDEHRFENAAKRRAFNAGAIRYDKPFVDDEGNPMEDRSLSDCGKGAAALYSELDRGGYAECVILPDGRQVPVVVPKWQLEFGRIVDSLDSKDRAVVAALFADMRPAVAARIAGVNRRRVYRVMDTLKAKLVHVHEMWLSHISGVLR